MSEEPTAEDRAEFDRLTRELTTDTYATIGRCITAWSKLESFLVNIATVLLDSETEKTGLVLYSINNFHTWLAIIEELFAIDPRYTSLRSDWIKISKRLKKLNDTRVSLAHHALGPGKGIEHFVESDDDEFSAMFPTLRPSQFDTRTRSKRHTPVGMMELQTFIAELGVALEQIDALLDRMLPIFLEQKKEIAEGIKRVKEKLHEMNVHRLAIRTAYGG